MDETLIFSLATYLVAPVAFIGLISYILQAYFRRDYLAGKDTARKFIADPFEIEKEIVSNPEKKKEFQENIFEYALRVNRDEFTSEINNCEQKMQGIIGQIAMLRDQRALVISQARMWKEKEMGLLGEKLQIDITKIDNGINQLSDQLTDVKNKKISRASDDVEHRVMYTARPQNLALLKLKECSARFLLVWFAFCLVVVDYFIAISLFKDLALDYRGQQWLYLVVAYAVPLVITFLELFFIHRVFKNFQEKNYFNISTIFFIILSTIFASLVLLIRISLVYSNKGDVTNYLQEFLLWLLFVGIVIVVGYKSAHHENEAPVEEILEAPFLLLVYVCSVIVIAPIWLLEYVFSSKQNAPEVRRVIELKKRIKELQADKSKYNKEYNEGMSSFENEFRQRSKLGIRGIDSQIIINENKLEQIESKKNGWEKRLKNLKLGAYSGVIIGLQEHTTYKEVQ